MQRLTMVSSKPFDAVMAALDEAIGRPDMVTLGAALRAASGLDELERIVERAIGPSGFMEFLRLDLGAVIRLEHGGEAPKIIRLIIGNPLVMKEMVKHVPEAGSYAPLTVLVDESADGVRLSYDTMEGHLSPYGDEEALRVARRLDAKVEALLAEAAG